MKIKLENLPLKKKTYEVRSTVKNMRLTYRVQKDFASVGKRIDELQKELDRVESEDKNAGNDIAERIMDESMESIDDALDYVYAILKLSDEDIEKVEDNLNQNEAIDLANEIAVKLMGGEQSDSDLKSK